MKSCLGHKSFFVVVLCASVLGFGAKVANCRTINVRADGTGDYSTIQDAIDDCNDGDIIACANGVYTGPGNRDIDFLGKAVTVRGTDPNDPNIVATTIIDCNGSKAHPHRGFYFHSGEGPNSILAGFTIINGYARYGGAIFCDSSSPTINNCTFSNNSAAYNGYSKHGGGIYCDSSSPTINGCTFSSNSANRGGGMHNYNYSSPTVEGCSFTGNSTSAYGGGMYNDSNSSPKVKNCTFTSNWTEHGGGGMYNDSYSNPIVEGCAFISNSAASSNGGGMYNYQSSPTVKSCKFITNSARRGGGMYNYWHSSPAVEGCTFSANWVSFYGGGMYNGYSSPMVESCTFTGNLSYEDGGGMCNYESRPTLNGCTFSGNWAASRPGGGMCNPYGRPEITNCILWADEPSEIYGGSPSVTYSDVQGGWYGTGNINTNPRFVEPVAGDYHLQPDSPCINAGDPSYIPGPNETDLDGNRRVMGGRIDMGAYEFYINTVPVACIVGGDRAVEVGSGCQATVTLDASCSSDADSTLGTNDDIVYFDWYEQIDPCDPNSDIFLGSGQIIECNLPLGEHTIVLEVTDKAGAFDANEVTIIVEDTPPEFSLSVEPNVLWPPNHMMVEITPSWEVSDNCDESPDVTLVSITADGDGATEDDIQISDEGIWLRAERSGTGTGRIYTITYRAVDDSGNITLGSATVTVPHDRRKH